MLYHYKFGFPVNVRLPTGRFLLVYGRHAQCKAQERGVHALLPKYVDTSISMLVEMEVSTCDEVIKLVYRVPLDDARDICLAIVPEGTWFVKTVWVNARGDTHTTLCASRYARPTFVKRKNRTNSLDRPHTSR